MEPEIRKLDVGSRVLLNDKSHVAVGETGTVIGVDSNTPSGNYLLTIELDSLLTHILLPKTRVIHVYSYKVDLIEEEKYSGGNSVYDWLAASR